MYIICPKCNTNFVIEDSQISKNGRKVRCSKCKHLWLAKNDSKAKASPKKENIIPNKDDTKPITPETRFYDRDARLLPTIIEQKGNSNMRLCFYKWALTFLGVFITLSLDMINFGQFRFSKDFSVENINTVSLDPNKVRIDFTIVNNSSKTSNIPIIRYRFYDKNNKLITRKLVENNIAKLEPKQSIKITREFDVKPVNLDITLGSKLDFVIRY